MNLTDIKRACTIRNGAIDAMDALNAALIESIVGLEDADHQSLKIAFGRAMGEISVELIHPVVKTFPELEPSSATWRAVAKSRAMARSQEL
jgi:hypothetical protein